MARSFDRTVTSGEDARARELIRAATGGANPTWRQLAERDALARRWDHRDVR